MLHYPAIPRLAPSLVNLNSGGAEFQTRLQDQDIKTSLVIDVNSLKNSAWIEGLPNIIYPSFYYHINSLEFKRV